MSTRPLRVLQVIPGIAARYGGPSRVVTALSGALAAHGLDVLVASTDADGDGRLDVPLGDVVPFEGTRAIFFARRGGDGFKYSPDLARWLRQTVGQFDVVHIHAVFSHASIAAARSCWRHGVPYVLRPLGTLAPWALEQKRWQKRALLRVAGRRMIARAAVVHYTTEAEARLTESTIGATRRLVLPPGLGDEWLGQPVVPAAEREPIVFALARLHPVKNLEAAIGAFHLLGEAARAWHLVVAGDGETAYRQHLQALAAAGPAHDRISFPGWMDEATARAWLARASVFVQPSHQESFGVSVLEAMASGVPVVIARGVSLAEDVERAGAGWVTAPDHASVAEALGAAIGSAGERSQRAAAARAMAAAFTWPATAARLVAVYEQVARDPRMYRAS
ncbi:MAG TPA: glycosyltransferase [Vicinamibacterales bacterium]|nr:glycosyltransferase [Vicinamibacterales bacterium]